MNKVMPTDQAMGNPADGRKFSDAEVYTSLSKNAVVAVVTGLLSLIGFYFPIFMVLGLVATVCGFAAYRTIRSCPHEFTGKIPAMLGMLMGLASVVGGMSFHSYIYATEVREGYERISFSSDLKTDANAQAPITKRSQELDGEKIFIKGYVRPGLRKNGISEFLLVGDLGQCCFGGSPKLSEVVRVKLPEDVVTYYDFGIRKIHGTFKLHERLQKADQIADDVEQGYVYEIEADSISY